MNHIVVEAVLTLRALTPILSEALKKCQDPLHLELLSTQLDDNPLVNERREKPLLQAYSYEYLGPGTGDHESLFKALFNVPNHFGRIGAVLVQNVYAAEILVKSIVLDGLPDDNEIINFICNSWVSPSGNDPDLHKRIFFTTMSYLPCQTPEGLVERRKTELENLRGNGEGKRESFDRIYDYDVYNDLGDPDTNEALKRTVLGGSKEYPYPRRCRTGRPMSGTDTKSEKRPTDPNEAFYVPRDEQFSTIKGSDFNMNQFKASQIILRIPFVKEAMNDPNLRFESFADIDAMFNKKGRLDELTTSRGIALQNLPDQGDLTTVMLNFFRPAGQADPDDGVVRDHHRLLFDRPDVFERDTFGWLRDEEFARQTLAGTNPCGIKLLKEWPIMSKLDAKVYGSPVSAITTELIQPLITNGNVERALGEKKLFVLDFHDMLMPYVNQVIRGVPGTTLYASRTVFYLTPEGMLKPLAIELTRPPNDDKPQWKKVYTPKLDGTGLWLWRLAKAHVLAHDATHHQLISHWLRAHCCTEPYIIAANRQLSAMHPIYRLLLPHFRYNMEINALARKILINADGVMEFVFAARKYGVELSSSVYRDEWRFDLQGLPADLISRGMAEETRFGRHGLKLAIEDYPFANDGLLLWDAIKQWVTDYVNVYYAQEDHWLLSAFQSVSKALTRHRDHGDRCNFVRSDDELQRWWKEIQEVGHGDKNGKPGWPKLQTRQDLIGILTTIIWVSSGHHAAVNFGQYAYSGYVPNRPSIARTKMPDEEPFDPEEWKEFEKRPEEALLKSFPSIIQTTKEMVTMMVLSSHSPDEEYIGGRMEESWEEEVKVREAFEKFQAKLTEMEEEIDARNQDEKKKNRVGAGIVPYQLLKPLSGQGVTGMGVPNSISI